MNDTIVNVLPYQVDLAKPIKKTYLETLFATEDNEAHRFDVSLYRDKTQLEMTSGTAISAYFIRYSDNATITLEGNLNGNVASVTLKKACYRKAGQFALIIKALDGGVINTVFYGEGTIFVSKTDTILDEENVIPSLEDLLAQIAVMEAATDRANTAAEYAESLVIDASGCAENTNKLGGKPASAYVLKEDMSDIGCTFVTPQMFGAKADGVTDDSEAIQAAFDAGNYIAFPKGDYHFSGITCTHDVHVIFSGANLKRVFPAYDPDTADGSNLVQFDSGVFENFFSFSGCNVVMEGLALIGEDKVTKRAANYDTCCPPTRSIAEFDTCGRVVLKNWHVSGLALWNRGKTPAAPDFYKRKGIVFSAIDTDIIVQDCIFEDIQGDEWTWCTYNKNLAATKCTFDRCTFRYSSEYNEELDTVQDGNTAGTTKSGLSCVGIFLTSEAVVQNCTFEDISYYGSLVNAAGLRSVVRGNVISGCYAGSLFDVWEGQGYIFANEVIVENNVMSNGSSCDCFLRFAAKRAHICRNIGVRTGSFIYVFHPTAEDGVKDGQVISSIRILVEGNEALCTGLETATKNAFLRFDLTYVTGRWESGSEVIIRDNYFARVGSDRYNTCIYTTDVRKILVSNNWLFFGFMSTNTNHNNAYVAQLANANNTAQVAKFSGNVLDGSTIPTGDITKAAVLINGSKTASITLGSFLNVLDPAASINFMRTSGVASGCTTNETSNGNIGFNT